MSALFSYEVTTDERIEDSRYHINDEIRVILLNVAEKVLRKKNSVIKELNQLIQEYPGVPHFKNLLYFAFLQSGNKKMATQVNERILKEHPDFLQGKLNLVEDYAEMGEHDKIPSVLGEGMKIEELYPERTVFSFSEVISFYKTAILYFVTIGNVKAAESRLKILFELDSNENKVTDLKNIELTVLMAGMSRNIGTTKNNDSLPKKEMQYNEVEAISKKVVESAVEKPVFHHSEIEELYRNGMRIDHDVLRKILSLPKETLVADLHKVVYDSIARFDSFRNKTWDEKTQNFLVHALFLLSEINDESSLQVALDVLRQDGEYLDFWLGDHLTDSIWEILFILGKDRLVELKSFMMEPHRYLYARSEVAEAMKQLSLHVPERRDEAIQWFEEVLQYYVENKDDETLIDTTLIDFMVGDLVDISAVHSAPLINELYELGLVEEVYVGNIGKTKEELKSPFRTEPSDLHDIFSRYDDILLTWGSYREEKEDKEELDEEDDFGGDLGKDFYLGGDEDDIEDAEVLSIGDGEKLSAMKSNNTGEPIVRSGPKVGRNDPCPCGSGKKYKKCCGG